MRRGAFGTIEDATVWQSNPTYKDGASASLYTGVSSGSQRYTLLRHDLAFVPTGSAVCSAIFKVTQAWKSTSSTVRLHQVLVPWTETTATWNGLLGGWDPSTLGSFVAAGGSGDRAIDVTAMVQDWVDGVPNHGFLLEEDAVDRSQFYASDYASPAERRPRLELCYVAP